MNRQLRSGKVTRTAAGLARWLRANQHGVTVGMK